MNRRAIRDSITLTDNNNGKTYTASKRDFESAIRKWKIRIVSLGIVAGIGVGAIATPIIGNMVDNAKNANDTKQAIEMALSTDNYLKNIKSDLTLQKVISAEQAIAIEDLSSAITTYKQLQHKTDKTYNEEIAYMEACKKISESRDLVIDTYTDTIRGKVAKAYGITDAEKIEEIEIGDYIHNSSDGPEHGPRIVLPDGRVITKEYFLNPNLEMDSTLAKNVIRARALRDASGFSENMKIENLPIDEIIKTFEEAKEFDENYTVECKKNGDIQAVKIEKDKEVDDAEVDNAEHDR